MALCHPPPNRYFIANLLKPQIMMFYASRPIVSSHLGRLLRLRAAAVSDPQVVPRPTLG